MNPIFFDDYLLDRVSNIVVTSNEDIAGRNAFILTWSLFCRYHREDGPSIENEQGYKEWWLNGQLHREDGPARECPNGYKEWYINGNRQRNIGGND